MEEVAGHVIAYLTAQIKTSFTKSGFWTCELNWEMQWPLQMPRRVYQSRLWGRQLDLLFSVPSRMLRSENWGWRTGTLCKSSGAVKRK